MTMNFARLLTAGKSLVGLRESSHRYREDKNVRLPKFGSAKNPFASTVAAQTVVKETSEAVAVQAPKTEVVVERKLAAATARLDRGAEKKPKMNLAAPVRGLGEWGKKLNPFGRPKRGPVRSAAQPAQVPMQGELSLDCVKVVRNDLSDTDFELRSSTSLKAAPKTGIVAETLVPVGEAWNRLTTRFFGDDQT
jgi:hypothetical protein